MSSKPTSKPTSARSKLAPEEAAAAAAALAADEEAEARAAAESAAADEQDEDQLPGEQLDRALLRRGLSDIARTADRTGFAFTRLDLSGQAVRTLDGAPSAAADGSNDSALATYPELRYINLNNNEISDLAPLSVLPRLLSLQAAHNHLSDVEAFLTASVHPQLQLLQLDHNDIEYVLMKATSATTNDSEAASKQNKKRSQLALTTNFPSLFALTLSNNKLASLLRPEEVGSAAELTRHNGHPSLQILDLGFNQLSTLAGLGGAFPLLRILNLQANALTSLEGIEKLKQLEKLNVADNKLVSLSGELGRLKTLPALSNLILLAGNQGLLEDLMAAQEAAAQAAAEAGLAGGAGGEGGAVEGEGGVDMVSEVLIVLPRLVHLEGKRVSAALRARADQLSKFRAAERERREAEEAEAKKLAAAEEEAERKAREEEEDNEEKETGEDDEENEDEDAGADDGGADDGGDAAGDDGGAEQDDGGEQFDDGGEDGGDGGGDEDI